MVGKGRHAKNEINRAFKVARRSHFVVLRDGNGHRWGWIVCEICGERFPIWSTPRNAGNHAKQLQAFMDDHKHEGE